MRPRSGGPGRRRPDSRSPPLRISMSAASPGARPLSLIVSALVGGALIAAAGAGPRGALGERPTLYRAVGCVRDGGVVSYHHGPVGRRVVALSFDDGPSPYTAALVAMLAANNVPGTFFMIGRQVTSRYAATVRRELLDGDALGDHTFTHANLIAPGTDVAAELSETIAVIHSISGYTTCLFRPPHGAYTETIMRVAAKLGLATILWNVNPHDYLRPGTSRIVSRVLAAVKPGSIILSHDGGGPRGQTLAAYPRIIAALRARGYAFATVPQLLGFSTMYARCSAPCDGVGIPKPLPPGSVTSRSTVLQAHHARSKSHSTAARDAKTNSSKR